MAGFEAELLLLVHVRQTPPVPVPSRQSAGWFGDRRFCRSICTCTHIRTYWRTRPPTHTCIRTPSHTHTHTRAHTHVHPRNARPHAHIHVHVHTHIRQMYSTTHADVLTIAHTHACTCTHARIYKDAPTCVDAPKRVNVTHTRTDINI